MRIIRTSMAFAIVLGLATFAGVARAATNPTPITTAPLFAAPGSTFLCRAVSTNSALIAATLTLRNSQGTVLATDNVGLTDGEAAEISAPGTAVAAYCEVIAQSGAQADALRVNLIVRSANGNTAGTAVGTRNGDATTRVVTPGLTTGADSTLVCLVTNAGPDTQSILVRLVNDTNRAIIIESNQTVAAGAATGTTNASTSQSGHCEVFAATGAAGKGLRVSLFVWSFATGFGDARSAVSGQ